MNIFSSAATRFSSGSSGGSDAELSIRKTITGSSAAGDAEGDGVGVGEAARAIVSRSALREGSAGIRYIPIVPRSSHSWRPSRIRSAAR